MVVLLPLLFQDYRINILTIISVQIIHNCGLLDGRVRNDVVDLQEAQPDGAVVDRGDDLPATEGTEVDNGFATVFLFKEGDELLQLVVQICGVAKVVSILLHINHGYQLRGDAVIHSFEVLKLLLGTDIRSEIMIKTYKQSIPVPAFERSEYPWLASGDTFSVIKAERHPNMELQLFQLKKVGKGKDT